MRIAAGSYTNSKAISMKEWAGKNKDKVKENKRRYLERKKLSETRVTEPFQHEETGK